MRAPSSSAASRGPGPERAVLRLPLNSTGRDFVVGDIHGAYDLVWKAMKAVRFDPKRDRLFSVGDLIDRGEGSHRVLEFLAQPYVHAVRGNHDDDFCSVEPDMLAVLGRANFNGLRWVLNTNPDKLLAISLRLAKLPYAIEIETPRGLVGLVHADVPASMHWGRFTELLEAGDPQAVECALRSRARVRSQDASGVPGVGRVFVGHTISEGGPQRLGNVFCVDTGAFKTLSEDPKEREHGSLTIVSLVHRTADLANLPVWQQLPQLRVGHSSDAPEEGPAPGPFTPPPVVAGKPGSRQAHRSRM